MIDFAGTPRCRWGYLAGYFGEIREGGCGHCDVCLGEGSGILPGADDVRMNGADVAAVAALAGRREAALASPRQVARFLAGLTSPATSRARLTKDAMFGRYAGVSFAMLLEVAEGVLADRVPRR